jgi:hypothetical protein
MLLYMQGEILVTDILWSYVLPSVHHTAAVLRFCHIVPFIGHFGIQMWRQ